MDTGMMGGVIGGVLGIAGGALGTWMTVKNTKTPRERAFAIRAAVLTWLFVGGFGGGFLVALFLAPPTAKIYLWGAFAIAYPPALLFLILYINRGLAAARRDGTGPHA